MSFQKITTAGAGTMGSQVAWQMAFHGKRVTVYDAIPAGLDRGREFHREYADTLHGASGEPPRSRSTTPSAVLTYTDRSSGRRWPMPIWSANRSPSPMDIKGSFSHERQEHAPERTVFTTNSSTLRAELAGRLRRPARRGSWRCTSPSACGTPTSVRSWATQGPTRPSSSSMLTFAEEIGLVPIPIRKEQSGYIINSLLVPVVHRRARPAGAGRERLPEHRSDLDDHAADPDGALRDDGSHGPRGGAPRRGADRRDHFFL